MLKSPICDVSHLLNKVSSEHGDGTIYLNEILPRAEDEPHEEDMSWNHLKLFITWIKTGKVKRKIGNQRISFQVLWEFGREIQAPKYQNALLTHLCENDDFFQRILADDILCLYERVGKSGMDIHEHQFLRFCLDVVVFPGNRYLWRKVIELGGPLAMLVAEEAMDYAHYLATDPSKLPLGGRFDPTHPDQIHYYLLGEDRNEVEDPLPEPENEPNAYISGDVVEAIGEIDNDIREIDTAIDGQV